MTNEERYYQEWATGIVAVKEALNLLHAGLAIRGDDQLFLAVTCHSSQRHKTVILLAHTAFRYQSTWAGSTGESDCGSRETCWRLCGITKF